MKVLKNKWLIVFIVFVLVFSAGFGVGNYFVNYALSPSSDSDERNVEEPEDMQIADDVAQQISKNKEVETKKGKDWSQTLSSANIMSDDGYRLVSQYIDDQDTHQWAIMIHGYKSSNQNMMSYGYAYHQRGYNVVLPDNRAHGQSEGDFIGMGWLDKDDIALWVNWIIERDPEAKIVIHGVSMGGATTMMLSGMNLDHVVGYIEDCGYTSVWDIFASELEKRFSLPTFPILDISNVIANLRAGYDFKEASSLKQVQKCEKPMLFIHGGKDDFVPTDMVYEVYDAAQCEKELYIVDEAGHAEAKDYDVEAYWNKVFTFIDTYMNM